MIEYISNEFIHYPLKNKDTLDPEYHPRIPINIYNHVKELLMID